jgi:tRNA A37 threonylcarbamoyltransferase TsaD
VIELIDDAEFEAKGMTAPGWEEFKKRRAEGHSEYLDMPEDKFKTRKIDYSFSKEVKEAKAEEKREDRRADEEAWTQERKELAEKIGQEKEEKVAGEKK